MNQPERQTEYGIKAPYFKWGALIVFVWGGHNPYDIKQQMRHRFALLWYNHTV
jgi:hypothetical protein